VIVTNRSNDKLPASADGPKLSVIFISCLAAEVGGKYWTKVLYFLRILWRIEIVAILALVPVALVMGIALALRTMYIADGGSGFGELVLVTTALAIYVGILPVVLYGAPIFTWYVSGYSLPRWLLYVLATVPGFLLTPFGVGLTGVAAGILLAGTLEFVIFKWPALAKPPER
jgi:hypothetical protein